MQISVCGLSAYDKYSNLICCYLLITGQLPLESSSMDLVIFICTLLEFPGDQLFKEVSRVLKPGGTILIHKTSKLIKGQTDQVIVLYFAIFRSFLTL